MKGKIELVKRWFRKAERDLDVAKREMENRFPYTDIVCFHAQQAAEKFLKGYLVWLEIEPRKTHDLEDLVMIAAEKDREIIKFKDPLAELTPFAVEARYPEFDEPLEEDAKRAIENVERLKDYLYRKVEM